MSASAALVGWPLFALAIGGIFAIQWIAFVPAWLRRTERFFDLVGSATFIAAMLFVLVGCAAFDARSLLLTAMVCIWALRLGAFLTARMIRNGADRRFDAIKSRAGIFFMAWTLQGLWVSLAAGCALAALSAARGGPLGPMAAAGASLWAVGLALEIIADEQKRRFRARPENADRFIDTGLWSLCRHPNYLGEIVLWCGIALVALPALSGWGYATLVSPVFVWVLLTRISGIRLLEARGRQRWAGDPAYRAYVERTPPLLPRPRRR